MLGRRASGAVPNSEHNEFFVVVDAVDVGLVRVFAVLIEVLTEVLTAESVDGPVDQFNL